MSASDGKLIDDPIFKGLLDIERSTRNDPQRSRWHNFARQDIGRLVADHAYKPIHTLLSKNFTSLLRSGFEKDLELTKVKSEIVVFDPLYPEVWSTGESYSSIFFAIMHVGISDFSKRTGSLRISDLIASGWTQRPENDARIESIAKTAIQKTIEEMHRSEYPLNKVNTDNNLGVGMFVYSIKNPEIQFVSHPALVDIMQKRIELDRREDEKREEERRSLEDGGPPIVLPRYNYNIARLASGSLAYF